MPAAAIWLDQSAPAQWVLGQPDGDATVNPQQSQANQTFDTTLHYKLAGTIILALVAIWALQATGFRFVTSATVGVGR